MVGGAPNKYLSRESWVRAQSPSGSRSGRLFFLAHFFFGLAPLPAPSHTLQGQVVLRYFAVIARANSTRCIFWRVRRQSTGCFDWKLKSLHSRQAPAQPEAHPARALILLEATVACAAINGPLSERRRGLPCPALL